MSSLGPIVRAQAVGSIGPASKHPKDAFTWLPRPQKQSARSQNTTVAASPLSIPNPPPRPRHAHLLQVTGLGFVYYEN